MAGNRYYRFDSTAATNTQLDDGIARNIYTGDPLADPGFTTLSPVTESIAVATEFNTVGVTVIRDREITIEANFDARYFIATPGVHVYFINCFFRFPTGGSGKQAFAYNSTAGANGSSNFGTGVSALGRPFPLTQTAEATDRSFNFFGCTFICDNNQRVNWWAGRMQDCVVLKHTGNGITPLYTASPVEPFTGRLGPGYINNFFTTTAGVVTPVTGFNMFIIGALSSTTAGASQNTPLFINNRTDNVQLSPASGATASFDGYADASNVASYFIGNPDSAVNGIQSVNPITRITATGNVDYNGARADFVQTRVIESIRYSPTFVSTDGSIVPDIRGFFEYNYAFAVDANGNPVGLNTGNALLTPVNTSFTTDTNGNLTGPINPETGVNDLVPADGFAIPFNGIYALATAQVQRVYSSSIALRSFNTVIDSSGELDYTFDRNLLTPDGLDFKGTETFAPDLSLREDARTSTNLASYFSTLFNNNSAVDLQDINEYLKYRHYLRDEDLNYRGWSNGNLSFNGGIILAARETSPGVTGNIISVPSNGTLTGTGLTTRVSLTGAIGLEASGTTEIEFDLTAFSGVIGNSITQITVTTEDPIDLSGLVLETGHSGLTIVGVRVVDGGNITPPDILTGITFLAPPASITFPDTATDGFAGGGRYVYVDTTTNVPLVLVATYLNGQTIRIPPNANPLDYYIKPNNNLDDNIAYPLVIVRGISRTDPADTTATAAAYPGVIIGELAINPAGPTLDSTQFTDPAAIFNFAVAGEVTLTQQESKRLLLSLTDSNVYVEANARAFANGSITEEAIVPGQSSTTVNGDHVTLQNPIAQITLGNVAATGTLANTVTLAAPSFVARPAQDGISEGQVQNAINTSGNISTIRSNTDAMRPQVNSMANDRLIGIRPNTHRGDET